MKKSLTLGAILFLMALVTVAQQPQAPRETVTAMVGGARVAIEYGRPSLNGRTLETLKGDLPEDRMWRAGTNQVTTLDAKGDIMVGNAKVAAGKYSLYLYLGEDNTYRLAINTVLGQPLGKIFAQAPPELAKEPWPHFSYQKEIGDKEVARVSLKKQMATTATDLFTIQLEPSGPGAVLKMAWGNEVWSTSIKPVKKREGSED